jgi:hypothetical protein
VAELKRWANKDERSVAHNATVASAAESDDHDVAFLG